MIFNIGTDSTIRLQKRFQLVLFGSGSFWQWFLCFTAESVLVGQGLKAAPARPCGIYFPR